MARAKTKKSKDWIDDVRVEIVDLTPEDAAELLENNTHNRKLRPRTVNQYVNAMKAGDWIFNGDPIRVTDKGRLLDGQHRLTAIVESGIVATTILITGLPDLAQITMDTGAKRTFADYLKLQGDKNVTGLASAVRLWHVYDRALHDHASITDVYTPATLTELARHLDAHPDLRQATEGAYAIYTAGVRVPVGALAVAIKVLRQIDKEDAAFFFARLADGVGLLDTGRTQPILQLRRIGMTNLSSNRLRSIIILGSVFKCWNAFREGSRIAGNPTLRLGGAKPEEFPWPK